MHDGNLLEPCVAARTQLQTTLQPIQDRCARVVELLIRRYDFFAEADGEIALVSVFGGLAIYFDNKVFFYMKPTIINILFALILMYGKFFLKKSLLQLLLENSIKLKDEGWKILTDRWIYFFIFLAFLNEMVWRTQSEEIWVQFKVFGILPITFVFMIFQIRIIEKFRITNV